MTRERRRTIQFDALRIDGYKSFADPVTIPIEPGVTGIVGPVGCGKSNVVEAVQFGLGETSVKRMRGGESEHMVFAGNGNGRPPRSHAEVVLTVADPHGVAPKGMTDVGGRMRISRRIDRGQGTTYRINGKQVLLRDLKMLYKDNATGPNSTGMISQGKVAALISAKPSERRFVIEEAAGVSGSLLRRDEVNNRLSAAKENLDRADEALAGVSAVLRTLRRQAAQATQAREADATIRGHETALRADDLFLAIAAAETGRRAHASNEEIIATAILAEQRAVRERDAAVARHERVMADMSRCVIAEDRARVALEGQVAERARIAAARDRITKRLDEARRISIEIAGRIATEETTLAALVPQSGEAEARYASSQARLGPALDAQVEAERTLAIANEAMTAAAEAHAAAEGARRSAQAELTAAQAEHARVGRRAQDAARRLDEAVERLGRMPDPAAYAGAVSTIEATMAETTEARDALRDETEDAIAARAEATALLATVSTELTSARSELRAVAASTRRTGVHPGVTASKGYELALASALSIGLTAGDASDAPVRWSGASDSAPDLSRWPTLLRDVAVLPDAMTTAAASIVVVSPSDLDAVADVLPRGASVVDLDGRVVHWHGLRVSTPPDEAGAELRRRGRESELAASIPPLERREIEAREAHAREGTRCLALEGRTKAIAAELERLEQDRARLVRARSDAEAARVRTEAEVAAATAENVAAATSLQDVARRVASALEAIAALGPRDGTTEHLEASRTIMAEARRSQTQAIAAVEAIRSDIRSAQAEKAGIEARIGTTRTRLDDLGVRAVETENALLDVASELESAPELPADDDRAAASLAEASSATAEARAIAEAAAEARTQAERTCSTAGVELARITETRERLLDAIRVADAALTKAREHWPEGDGEPLDAARRPVVEAELVTARARRDRIGPVNLLAEQDLKEQETRSEDMERARRETLSSIKDLRESLEQIDAETRQRLLEAFEVVDGHFRTLATRIFGGGEASLRMIGDDPLDAGLEIYVSPPGKAIQAISLLSGGERTMASLALVFAAFLANPAPLCILDEADAALEDWTADIYCDLIHSMVGNDATRFIVVTHKPLTMARMDRLFGVTMTEPGVSRVARVDISDAVRMLDDSQMDALEEA